MTGKKTYQELEAYIKKLEKTVSELRRTEAMLKDEVIWQNILFHQSRDGIVVLDQDGKVYEANRKFADMLGYQHEEVYGLHVWDWDAVFSKKRLIEMLRSVDRTGDHFTTKHRRKDGSTFDVEVSTNGASYKGNKMILCICRDISKKKKAEKKHLELVKELKELKKELKGKTNS